MGIYGEYSKRLIEKQNIVTIEIYVDHSLYEQLLDEGKQESLQENVKANLTLKKNDKKVEITIRDTTTMNMNGGNNTKGVHGCAIKVTGPKSIAGTSGFDIRIPVFHKTGEAPYPGTKVPGEFKGGHDKAYVDPPVANKIKVGKSYPEEVNIALQFANEYQKQLNLIYYKPENEINQMELIKEILTKCDYIEKFTVGSNENTKKLKNELDAKKKKKESK